MTKITLSGYGRFEFEVKQSVFIGQAKRIFSPEEANEFVSEVRSEFPDARHSCYAWKFDSNMKMQKYSDDGEPSGTAGMPILSILEKNEITDSVIVVTRYFGGILLGKGGLVRAYTEAAQGTVREAQAVILDTGLAFSMSVPYAMNDKITYALKAQNWSVEDMEYGADVKFTCVCPETDKDKMIKLVTDISAGTVIPEKTGERELLTGILDNI